MRLTLKVLAALLALFLAYAAYWQYQWRRAENAANTFCASVAGGSDIADTVRRLDAMGGMRHGFQENESRYVAIFPGPIFNAFTCELALDARKVLSAHVIAPED